MSERFICVVGIGLIGVDKNNEPYRQVIFRDEDTKVQAELMVRKKERPSLWNDIEKLEMGGNLPPYRGCIASLNSLDIVVFENETINEAFERQKAASNSKSKISFYEAEAMREKSNGYVTNKTQAKILEMAWHKIDKDVSTVKFRAYSGKGEFVWSKWFEITKEKGISA